MTSQAGKTTDAILNGMASEFYVSQSNPRTRAGGIHSFGGAFPLCLFQIASQLLFTDSNTWTAIVLQTTRFDQIINRGHRAVEAFGYFCGFHHLAPPLQIASLAHSTSAGDSSPLATIPRVAVASIQND